MTQKKFILVAVDYFTKWIEVETLKSIFCKFRIPRVIITNKSTQLQRKFKKFCTNLQIALAQSLVKKLQTNRQVETINKKILTALKKKVSEAKGAWLEELPRILWALRTTSHIATGETTFSLAYDEEATIPVEICLRSHRTQHFDEEANQEANRLNLDLIDELRKSAEIRNEA
ncbi:rve domain-containing protein [Gossypium australe]|uniref:Rve domain-containing protein n=1 Tax=Gossypium australe TaxID=47621 RepID=A0A5B6V1I7_9ROSI|nr:rve domain-containing protein [Gossypium australe]